MSFLKKNLLVGVFVVMAATLVVWVLFFSQSTEQAKPSTDLILTQPQPLRVVASFYPVAEFARAVGGNFVDVSTVVPVGTEPHEYEPTSEQVASLYAANIVLYNGGGLDAWAERISPELQSHGVNVVRMANILNGQHGSLDPHFWIDPVLAQKEVLLISEIFSQKDSVHADIYKKNAEMYVGLLKELDNQYKTELARCQKKTVVTSHTAFAYLSARYGFDVIPIAGLSPEDEPSAGRLAELTRIVREQGIQYIYFESLVNTKLAQTLANEVGAKTLVFNPLEGLTQEEQSQGKNYFSVMKDNLHNLKIGMVCP